MSAPTASDARSRVRQTAGVSLPVDTVRTVALGGVGLLMVAFFSLLYHFIDVTGQPLLLLVEAVIAVGTATYLSSSLRARMAAGVSAGLLAVGLTLYVVSLPTRPPVVPLVVDAPDGPAGRVAAA